MRSLTERTDITLYPAGKPLHTLASTSLVSLVYTSIFSRSFLARSASISSVGRGVRRTPCYLDASPMKPPRIEKRGDR